MERIHNSTVRKDIERHLEIYSWMELVNSCRRNLADLIRYPEENKWQIKYYEKYWKLLNEY
jgi:hypothetical protein